MWEFSTDPEFQRKLGQVRLALMNEILGRSYWATRDGDEWAIDGEKWFSSNARYATFLIVMVVTDPDAKPHERMSMFIVPAHTPGVEIIRNVGTVLERDDLDEGIHGYVRYHQVRVPLDAMLGAPGAGFKVAQSRLGGGRVHHAMRVVGKCQRAFDMMCERALSRQTQGRPLAEHQFVQAPRFSRRPCTPRRRLSPRHCRPAHRLTARPAPPARCGAPSRP
jgi:hypothetical protein